MADTNENRELERLLDIGEMPDGTGATPPTNEPASVAVVSNSITPPPPPTPNATAPADEPRSFPNGTKRFWFAVIATYITLYLLWKIAILKILKVSAITLAGQTLHLDTIFWLALAVYTFKGFQKVEANQLGLKKFFGRPFQLVFSGLIFVPPVVCEAVLETTNFVQLIINTPEIPRDPDGKPIPMTQEEMANRPHFVEYGTNSGIRLVRSMEPLRTMWAAEDPSSTFSKAVKSMADKDAVNGRLTTDPRIIIQWSIYDYALFIRNVGGVEQANALLEEVARSLMSEVAGKMTPSAAIGRFAELNETLKDRLETRIGDPNAKVKNIRPDKRWGIDIQVAKIDNLGFSHELNSALSSARAAIARAQATAIAAQAEKEKRTLEGEGTAAARRSFLFEEASGLAEQVRVINAGGEGAKIVLAAKTAEATFGNTEKIIVVPDSGPLGHMASLASLTTSMPIRTQEADTKST